MRRSIKFVALIPSIRIASRKILCCRCWSREAAIRFLRHVQYRDRQGRVQPVDWVVAIPFSYHSLGSSFNGSRNKQQRIQRDILLISQGVGFYTAWCI